MRVNSNCMSCHRRTYSRKNKEPLCDSCINWYEQCRRVFSNLRIIKDIININDKGYSA